MTNYAVLLSKYSDLESYALLLHRATSARDLVRPARMKLIQHTRLSCSLLTSGSLRNRSTNRLNYIHSTNSFRNSATMATTAMQKANRLRTAFSENKGPSYGIWQMLPGTNISRALARSDPDWIMVDCEHGNIDDAAMHEAVPAIAASGVSPCVRIPDLQSWMIKSESTNREAY